MVVDSILKRTTNKTKVLLGNIVMNRWVQNARKMNKRVPLLKGNNEWYRNKGTMNKKLQQRRNVWHRKEVNSEPEEDYRQYDPLSKYPTYTLKV